MLFVRFFDLRFIKKTSLFKFIKNFTTKKENFQIKNSDVLHISSQTTDSGYLLEPPWRGSSNEYLQLIDVFLTK